MLTLPGEINVDLVSFASYCKYWTLPDEFDQIVNKFQCGTLRQQAVSLRKKLAKSSNNRYF